jgi:hypothetical protein
LHVRKGYVDVKVYLHAILFPMLMELSGEFDDVVAVLSD